MPLPAPSPMDCRSFRKHHLAYVDDTLPGVDVVRMQLHVAECEGCAAWDHRVRRSLLLARNHLGTIEPSAQFRARLEARLARERAVLSSAPSVFGGSRRGPVAGMALGLGVVALMVVTLQSVVPGSAPPVMPAAVVQAVQAELSAPDPFATRNTTPALIATVSSGMAILPALLLVDEALAWQSGADESASLVRATGYTAPNPEQR